MHRRFENQLAELKERLIHMGATAERMIDRAVQGVTDRSDRFGDEVAGMEQEVNDLHIEVDEKAIELLALQHPVAADLRAVVMISRIAGELERIADQAVNIWQQAKALLAHRPGPIPADLPVMADLARGMVRNSLDAFMRRDAETAQRVLDTDDRVDGLKERICAHLLAEVTKQAALAPSALALILISRNLERIGDHATNIAEEVIYMVQGREVRHHYEEKKRREE